MEHEGTELSTYSLQGLSGSSDTKFTQHYLQASPFLLTPSPILHWWQGL